MAPWEIERSAEMRSLNDKQASIDFKVSTSYPFNRWQPMQQVPVYLFPLCLLPAEAGSRPGEMYRRSWGCNDCAISPMMYLRLSPSTVGVGQEPRSTRVWASIYDRDLPISSQAGIGTGARNWLTQLELKKISYTHRQDLAARQASRSSAMFSVRSFRETERLWLCCGPKKWDPKFGEKQGLERSYISPQFNVPSSPHRDFDCEGK